MCPVLYHSVSPFLGCLTLYACAQATDPRLGSLGCLEFRMSLLSNKQIDRFDRFRKGKAVSHACYCKDEFIPLVTRNGCKVPVIVLSHLPHLQLVSDNFWTQHTVLNLTRQYLSNAHYSILNIMKSTLQINSKVQDINGIATLSGLIFSP